MVVFTLTGSGTSILFAMYYRYRSTFINKSLDIFSSRKCLIPAILLHVVPSCPVIISFSYTKYIATNPSDYEEIFTKHPYIRNITDRFPCTLLVMSNSSMYIVFFLVFLNFGTYSLLGLIFQIMSFGRLKKMGITPTKNFVRMQKQLLFALFIQVAFNFMITVF